MTDRIMDADEWDGGGVIDLGEEPCDGDCECMCPNCSCGNEEACEDPDEECPCEGCNCHEFGTYLDS